MRDQGVAVDPLLLRLHLVAHGGHLVAKVAQRLLGRGILDPGQVEIVDAVRRQRVDAGVDETLDGAAGLGGDGRGRVVTDGAEDPRDARLRCPLPVQAVTGVVDDGEERDFGKDHEQGHQRDARHAGPCGRTLVHHHPCHRTAHPGSHSNKR
jgi:hypothetical protein